MQGLVEHAVYKFRIIAVNEIGESEASEPTEDVLCKDPHEVPSPPEDIEVQQVTKNSITLAWNKPSYDGGVSISGYSIQIRYECKFEVSISDNFI